MELSSKIYVAGHRGMVGSAIVKDLEKKGYNNIVTRTSQELNLINQNAVADFFAAEKWKIASDKQGSGNTANIGSIVDIDDLRNGNGIFSKLGEKWFNEYWINYGSATMIKDGKPVKITTLKDFLEFKGKTNLWKKIVAKTANKKTK